MCVIDDDFYEELAISSRKFIDRINQRAGYDQKDIAENVELHRIQSNHLIAKYIMTDKELEDIYKELDEDF